MSEDTVLEFPINQQLLEDTIHAREQWRVIKDRIDKIDQNKGQVSAVVYERVRSDYNGKLALATQTVMQKKEAVDSELATLKETRARITTELNEHRHKLEEIVFRNSLGEFLEEEYQSQARSQQDKISKFETVLNAINNNITRYEAIFAEDTDLFAEEPEEPPVKGALPENAHVTTSDSEDVDDIIEELASEEALAVDTADLSHKEKELDDNYFGTTEADKTSPAITEESQTAKAQEDSSFKHKAKIVMISGDDTGKAYYIKGIASFGRAESNTIVLRDAKVSRQHAQIQQQGNEYVIVDLNSSNGTYINRQRVEEHVLSNGDEIQIGDFVLQFQL